MNKFMSLCAVVILLSAASISESQAQVKWAVGMRMGLNIGTGGASVSMYNWQTQQYEKSGGTSAGFQFGPFGEVIFNKDMAIMESFNINTQAGTPIEWSSVFKYYFLIPGSKIKPYADAGFSLVFATGGPYVAIPFGGGALFPIAKNLYIPADIQFGPIFAGNTQFGINITSGIRYEIP
jgi:hypothetical protein